jgi:hypothetical protein
VRRRRDREMKRAPFGHGVDNRLNDRGWSESKEVNVTLTSDTGIMF